MNKLLKDLYDCFYTPPELAATKREIEECHRALIEALGKPERRLVLKIIDAKDHISEDTSLDSFMCDVQIPIPNIGVQKSIAEMYTVRERSPFAFKDSSVLRRW